MPPPCVPLRHQRIARGDGSRRSRGTRGCARGELRPGRPGSSPCLSFSLLSRLSEPLFSGADNSSLAAGGRMQYGSARACGHRAAPSVGSMAWGTDARGLRARGQKKLVFTGAYLRISPSAMMPGSPEGGCIAEMPASIEADPTAPGILVEIPAPPPRAHGQPPGRLISGVPVHRVLCTGTPFPHWSGGGEPWGSSRRS